MREPKRIKRGERVPITLSPRERQLMLSFIIPPPEIEDKLRACAEGAGPVAFGVTLGELEEILGYVAAEANHADTRKLEEELDGLYDRLTEVLDSYAEEGEPGGARMRASAMPRDVYDLPDPELGDLSPRQSGQLVGADWDDPDGPIRINDQLTLAELDGVDMLHNARAFLQALVTADGVKATAKGNLTRKFVAEMLTRFRWPEGYVEGIRIVSKVLNEMDVFPLHILRILLDLGGLIWRAKGVFRATKKGNKLLAEEKAGALYALLFRTHFRKFNLAYLDFGPELRLIQDTITFSLFMVAKHAEEWKTAEELASLVLFPGIAEQVPQSEYVDRTALATQARILEPLETLGLLESREAPSEREFAKNYEFRKTDLFDAFLTFSPQPPSGLFCL